MLSTCVQANRSQPHLGCGCNRCGIRESGQEEICMRMSSMADAKLAGGQTTYRCVQRKSGEGIHTRQRPKKSHQKGEIEVAEMEESKTVGRGEGWEEGSKGAREQGMKEGEKGGRGTRSMLHLGCRHSGKESGPRGYGVLWGFGGGSTRQRGNYMSLGP